MKKDEVTIVGSWSMVDEQISTMREVDGKSVEVFTMSVVSISEEAMEIQQKKGDFMVTMKLSKIK